MLKFLRNVQPTSSEVDEDLKELKAKVAQFKGGFVPWSEEISSNDLDQILQEGKAKTGSGVFMSTSSEPIFAYAFRNYIGPGRNAVIYILTLEHEFIFRITNKGTEVTIDNEKKGLIRENGVYYNRMNDEIAKVKRHGATGTNKIYIGEEEIAKIALPDAISSRALEVSKIDLSELEQEIVQTMTVYELVANIGEIN
ncbi:MAG: hypothetical protein GY810_26930 [Aureispira sp.]|nr:hypothetical protein [Aureispira sp.]